MKTDFKDKSSKLFILVIVLIGLAIVFNIFLSTDLLGAITTYSAVENSQVGGVIIDTQEKPLIQENSLSNLLIPFLLLVIIASLVLYRFKLKRSSEIFKLK